MTFLYPPDTSPEVAEEFLDSFPTSERNKAFLRLRYLEGKTYKEIGSAYGITPTGVRMALKTLWEKYGGETAGVLIVDPASLNGIALIETIRVLYRRVGAENFEEALDELREALCSIAAPSEAE